MDLVEIERAIIKKYRHDLWHPFIKAIKDFELIEENDKIAVCISGGKDSLLLAKLFQELHRHSKFPFEVEYISMNPGFNEFNLQNLTENARALNIPIEIRESNVFAAAAKMDKDYPCYFCARMRRGFLYQFAKSKGCNKIALAHHFDDVIETTMLNVLYAGNFGTMMPKLKSTNFEGMELIRPMIYIREADVKRYIEYIGIKPMTCGCTVTQQNLPSKRREVKELINTMRKINKNVDINIFRSAQNVNLNCVMGWHKGQKKYNFLDHSESSEDNDF